MNNENREIIRATNSSIPKGPAMRDSLFCLVGILGSADIHEACAVRFFPSCCASLPPGLSLPVTSPMTFHETPNEAYKKRIDALFR